MGCDLFCCKKLLMQQSRYWQQAFLWACRQMNVDGSEFSLCSRARWRHGNTSPLNENITTTGLYRQRFTIRYCLVWCVPVDLIPCKCSASCRAFLSGFLIKHSRRTRAVLKVELFVPTYGLACWLRGQRHAAWPTNQKHLITGTSEARPLHAYPSQSRSLVVRDVNRTFRTIRTCI